MFILCHAAKNEPMKIDFGKPKSQVCLLAFANKQTLPRSDVPSETSLSARANDVALSLHSCLREVLHIQILRSHFDGKPLSASRKHKFSCLQKQT